MSENTLKAVLGPTNTGKTHLAIERMCAHSSGAIGFPLRLLAREVYDKVVAIKGEGAVALVTGEERITPESARYFLCTAEAMPGFTLGMDTQREPPAFVALDEVQLAADPERGHIFTDRLLHARGREETMLLGASTIEPLIKQLLPRAEIVSRPRFSTLSHVGPRKLSRLPPRSAVVAFSVEQVYALAEMLRRFRGGSAVVMGGLSPETRNRQVELYQSGEVDYIVATDAIGMGLNLDVNHVAFGALSKFDGRRRRRLTPAEMAQIAGRAGRHQRDGTFGVLCGSTAIRSSRAQAAGIGGELAFTDEEIFAIEENRFAPLTYIYWREAEPRTSSLAELLADLELSPSEPGLVSAPESIDLAVLRLLMNEPLAADIRGQAQVSRFWDTCRLPDFRQQGPEMHARFVARLWQDLRDGYIGADFVATRIAQLDNVQGDIDTLQGRIAAIRSWAYICQRPDWVLARGEMAERARAAEQRLSDALHARLTERFVNKRTALLMRALSKDKNLLSVTHDSDGVLRVEDEEIGRLQGFLFVVDHRSSAEDRKMLLAAGEKALPGIMAERAAALIASEFEGVTMAQGKLWWQERAIAELEPIEDGTALRLTPTRDLDQLAGPDKERFVGALSKWVDQQLAPLASLRKMREAVSADDTGSEARALLLRILAGHGYVSREDAGLQHLPKEMRPFLRRLGVCFGALDVFVRDTMKPAPRLVMHNSGIDTRPLIAEMPSVVALSGRGGSDSAPGNETSKRLSLPAGYRAAGDQAVRIDIAERILREAYTARGDVKRGKTFTIAPDLAISTGLSLQNFRRLLRASGFRVEPAPALVEGAFGPPQPDAWHWRPPRRAAHRSAPHYRGATSERMKQRANLGQNTTQHSGRDSAAKQNNKSDAESGSASSKVAGKKGQDRKGLTQGKRNKHKRSAGTALANSPFAKLADLLD